MVCLYEALDQPNTCHYSHIYTLMAADVPIRSYEHTHTHTHTSVKWTKPEPQRPHCKRTMPPKTKSDYQRHHPFAEVTMVTKQTLNADTEAAESLSQDLFCFFLHVTKTAETSHEKEQILQSTLSCRLDCSCVTDTRLLPKWVLCLNKLE